LKENPEIADSIEQKIKVKLGVGVPRPVADLPIEEITAVVEDTKPVAKAASNG